MTTNFLTLETASIIHVRGSGTISKGIRYFSRIPGEPVTESNHVGIMLGPPGIFAETVWKGSRAGYANELLANRGEIRIGTPLNLTFDQKKEVVSSVWEQLSEARGYGYGKIVLQLGDNVASRIFRRNVVLFRRMAKLNRYPICSAFVARAYASVGLDFGIEYNMATPDDILDFQLTHPEYYRLSPWIPAPRPVAALSFF